MSSDAELRDKSSITFLGLKIKRVEYENASFIVNSYQPKFLRTKSSFWKWE